MTHRATSTVPLAVLLVLLCAPPGVVRAGGSQNHNGKGADAGYQTAIEQAVTAFGAQDFEAAARHFARAHTAAPSARTLRGLGMMAFELRRYEDALNYLQASLNDPRKPLESPQREAVEDLIERTMGFLGIFMLTVIPENAEVRVDGKPAVYHEGAIWLRVGPREVSIGARGHEKQVLRLEVLGHERLKRTVVLSKQSPPQQARDRATPLPKAVVAEPGEPHAMDLSERLDRPVPGDLASQSLLPWLVAGVGGAMAVSSIVTGVLARQTETDLQRLCGDAGCEWNDLAEADALQTRGRGLALATDVLLFGGIGVAGAGLLYWLVDTPAEDDSPLLGSVVCLPNRCHGSLRARF